MKDEAGQANVRADVEPKCRHFCPQCNSSSCACPCETCDIPLRVGWQFAVTWADGYER